MAIIVERKPYVVVTDEETGWTLTGGRPYPDGSSTKEMAHANGATCTLHLMDQSTDNNELLLRVTGMHYRKPGEPKGNLTRAEARRLAGPLYVIAGRLVRAWYEATYKTMPPLHISLPKH